VVVMLRGCIEEVPIKNCNPVCPPGRYEGVVFRRGPPARRHRSGGAGANPFSRPMPVQQQRLEVPQVGQQAAARCRTRLSRHARTPFTPICRGRPHRRHRLSAQGCRRVRNACGATQRLLGVAVCVSACARKVAGC